MEESMKRCSNGKTCKNKALCDRQNSEISMKLHGSDAGGAPGREQGGTSENSAPRDPELAGCEHSQKCEKCSGPKTMYIEVDKNVDARKVGRNSDFVVVVKSPTDEGDKSQMTRPCCVKKLCKYFIMIVACVVISVLCGTYIVPIFSGERKVPVPVELCSCVFEDACGVGRNSGLPPARYQNVGIGPTDRGEEFWTAPHAEKLSGSMSNASQSGFHWATFYLNDDFFKKGMEPLPWKLEEGDAGISVTSSGCLQLSKSSVYEIYSKITFEFTQYNNTDEGFSLYHNVLRVRPRGTPPIDDVDFLDKNILSAPYRPTKVNRVFQTSSLIVLAEFLAGDKVCVHVEDTSLVYNAKSDNTVKITQRGD